MSVRRRVATLVVAAVVSFGVVFGVATATDGSKKAPAPAALPTIPPVRSGEASIGSAAPLPALRPARKRRRPRSPAPTRATAPDPPARKRAQVAPPPVTRAPVAPVPRPRPQPPAPRPNPGKSFDDAG